MVALSDMPHRSYEASRTVGTAAVAPNRPPPAMMLARGGVPEGNQQWAVTSRTVVSAAEHSRTIPQPFHAESRTKLSQRSAVGRAAGLASPSLRGSAPSTQSFRG